MVVGKEKSEYVSNSISGGEYIDVLLYYLAKIKYYNKRR